MFTFTVLHVMYMMNFPNGYVDILIIWIPTLSLFCSLLFISWLNG